MRASAWVAVVCPATARILVARRGAGARNAGAWNLFGGRVDAGERPERAAVRELREEGGVRTRRSRLQLLATNKTDRKRNYLYGLAVAAEFTPRLNAENDQWRWITAAELEAMDGLHEPTRLLAPVAARWATDAAAMALSSLPEASDAGKDAPPRRTGWRALLARLGSVFGAPPR